MRVRKRFSKKQLKHVKQALKEQKSNEVLDEIEQQINEEHDVVKSIKDVRAELRRIAEEDGYDLKAVRKLERQAKKEARKIAAIEHPVLVSWNLNIGDAVECNVNGETHIGIIIDQKSDGQFFNFSQAKYRNGVMVMTSAGKMYLRPNQIVKI